MSSLEVLIPEALRAIRWRCATFYSQQFYHEVVDLHVLKCFHDIGIIRRRVPSFVRPGQETFEEVTAVTLLDRFDDRREGSVRNKHCMHRRFRVVVSVILRQSEL